MIPWSSHKWGILSGMLTNAITLMRKLLIWPGELVVCWRHTFPTKCQSVSPGRAVYVQLPELLQRTFVLCVADKTKKAAEYQTKATITSCGLNLSTCSTKSDQWISKLNSAMNYDLHVPPPPLKPSSPSLVRSVQAAYCFLVVVDQTTRTSSSLSNVTWKLNIPYAH